MTRTTSILVADDQPIVADALSRSLERWYRVVGLVTSLTQLESAIRTNGPDVVLLDLGFGRTSALTSLPGLVTRYPKVKFVILTAHAEPALADAALRAGAMAYIVKHSAATELRVAIDEAMAGRKYLTPMLQVRGAGGALPALEEVTITLSDRQRAVLGLLRAGHTYRRIGDQLGISEKTVEYHIDSISRRVGVRGKAQLVRWSETLFRSGEEEA